MQKSLFIGIATLFFFACSDAPAPGIQKPAQTDTTVALAPPTEAQERGVAAPPPVTQSLRGMYKSGADGASFYDCTAGKTYAVRGRPVELDSLYYEACQPAPYENESVYAVVRGQLTPVPAGQPVDGVLRITGIDTITAKTMFNTCLAYDFWCLGTEPFWGLLISENEAGLFLKNIGEERGRRFTWAAPKVQGNTWTYSASDPATREKVNVVVRKTPCSDGMSDRRYNYAVELRIGEQTLKGCAVRYGERIARE